MRPVIFAVALLVLSTTGPASAQDVFHSVQSANLPTATTLPGGSWLFEISHRFDTPVSGGADDLWGLDGPVVNRLGLSYSVTDGVALGVLRSNFKDNVELNAKWAPWGTVAIPLPLRVAVMGGVSWLTQPSLADLEEGGEDNERQAYVQLIVNAGIGDRLALGVVPTYLRNPRIRDVEEADAFVLGLNGQLYVSRAASLLVEWAVSGERPDMENDAASFGVELETRGHFFKLLLTNQARLNPTQFLAGTPTDFEPGEWRFGFNITRLLPF